MKKLLSVLLTIVLIGALSIGVVSLSFADTSYTKRLSGADRIATAIEISKAVYPSGSPNFVIICRSDNYADALTAAGLIKYNAAEAPILLTPSDALDSRVKAEITRLNPTGGGVGGSVKCYIAGGTGAISSAVETELKGLLGSTAVKRIGGADRYETATLIDKEMNGGVGYRHTAGTLIVATGENFPDALAGAAYAAYNSRPILLVRKDSVPERVISALSEGKPSKIVILGGSAAVSTEVFVTLSNYLAVGGTIVRVSGADRYATCVAIAESSHLWNRERTGNYTTLAWAFARGDDFPDALAAAFLCADKACPLLLTNSTALNSTVNSYLQAVYPTNLSKGTAGLSYLAGGSAAISSSCENEMAKALSGSSWQEVPSISIVSVAGDSSSPAYGNTNKPIVVVNHRVGLTGDKVCLYDGTTLLCEKAVTLNATQTTIATIDYATPIPAQGARNLTVKLKDNAGNYSAASSVFVYNYDAAGPTVSSVALSDNGTSVGTLVTGDRIIIIFTEAMDTTSIGTTNTVRVYNGDATLGTCISLTGVGRLDLNSTGYANNTLVGTYSASWSSDSKTLTLTLDIAPNDAIGSGTDFDVLNSVKDLAGNAAVDTDVLPTGSF